VDGCGCSYAEPHVVMGPTAVASARGRAPLKLLKIIHSNTGHFNVFGGSIPQLIDAIPLLLL